MTLRLNGTTSGYVEIDSASTGGNNTIVLPSSNGNANQFLKNGSTAGTLGWSSLVEDSSGRLLVGTSIARSNFFNTTLSANLQVEGTDHDTSSMTFIRNSANTGSPTLSLCKTRGASNGSNTAVQNGDDLGFIAFQGADGTDFVAGAYIYAQVENTPGANDMPSRLVFATTSDSASTPTERVRITASGTIESRNVSGSSIVCINNGVTNTALIYFQTTSAELGKIRINGAGVAYDTTSDYRLKENVEPITGAIDRVQALKPWRFNFISHPDVTVDGFLAHEAQEVVPEAVGGTKDEVDADGNPIYQGIDQSKLVPLLTAALQEAIAKIETLEAANAALDARLTALEAQS
jgi:hypothetical protein